MRLIRVPKQKHGELCLVEYAEKVPPYAILSHRWGADDEEVTFEDMVEMRGRTKKGYRKIRDCADQARKDGLGFFWVDTCCIDKSSSAELSEAINSMWSWYRKSEICYAYLNDCPARSQGKDRCQTLARSKWFTRGWTLQELLAPSKLVLYNVAWKAIGTKDKLAQDISEITGIDKYYLETDTSLLERASVAERMSWASARETKRPEDGAYSLLGIFNINMPLLYGEGTRAFQRLQEEIMKQSDDQSIFAWRAGRSHSGGGLLAQMPASFRASGNIVRAINSDATKPYAMTNRGLQIELPLLKRKGEILARLNCRMEHDFFSDLAIPLRRVGSGNQYERASGEVQSLPINEWVKAKEHSIYIKTTSTDVAARSDPKEGSVIIRELPSGYTISQVFPGPSWPHGSRIVGRLYTRRVKESILVMITSGKSHCVGVMISGHRNTIFRDWTPDARIIPMPTNPALETSHLHSHWTTKDTFTLPKAQRNASDVLYLRVANKLVRGKKLVVLDVVVSDGRYYIFQELAEKVIALLRATAYRLSRVLWWLLGTDDHRSRTITTLYCILDIACWGQLYAVLWLTWDPELAAPVQGALGAVAMLLYAMRKQILIMMGCATSASFARLPSSTRRITRS
ncbi:hypothetical protein HBH92_092530 [Parastagonospora nodorum]|nr:hypothetical protein HBI10_156010 [Parastagonospora nodorum]KAH4019068.1 hypothetical protein HBI13_130040 [Parastagonospora nodorum]KAH4413414.1 hypothetical protein HBH92_092530 [Parastagonospora nodorum]KAH4431929.1 hypothetical protein HBH93_142490 [Parastagonospora nodorum]KAH4448980.1 hypothetical protein HBH91_129860 [Parastagonospora nodorum]